MPTFRYFLGDREICCRRRGGRSHSRGSRRPPVKVDSEVVTSKEGRDARKAERQRGREADILQKGRCITKYNQNSLIGSSFTINFLTTLSSHAVSRSTSLFPAMAFSAFHMLLL